MKANLLLLLSPWKELFLPLSQRVFCDMSNSKHPLPDQLPLLPAGAQNKGSWFLAIAVVTSKMDTGRKQLN